MTKQTISSIIILILVAVGAILLTIWAKNYKPAGIIDPVVTNSDESKYLVTKEPQMVSVAEDSYLLGISGSYPQFVQADASFNKKIADTVTTSITDFKNIVDQDYEARLATGGDEFQKQFEQSNMYTLSWTTEVVQSNDNYISVIMRQEGFSGGAHGYHTATTFNYDVKNKKELMITDMISLDQVSSKSREILKKKFEQDGDTDTFEAFAINGTDPKKPENFQVFTFTNTALTVYFTEYQVAPYVYGESQVEIAR